MEAENRPDAILIAGPTASGKSVRAVELALRHGGEIINADSMQIYSVLNVLTARPEQADLARVPHHLYGYVPVNEAYSVARWLEDARIAVEQVRGRGNIPVFVGGTGLYFRAIEHGLAMTPQIPEETRQEVREDLIELGSEVLHGRLAALDPAEAERLRPSDSHRVARALEVMIATGKPLTWFQNQQDEGALSLGTNVLRLVMMPDRTVLHDRINRRAQIMLEGGAIEEVRQLLCLDLPGSATVLKAIGVKQLKEFILGESSLKDSQEALKAATRQYAKRQSTWFRGQFDTNWRFINAV